MRKGLKLLLLSLLIATSCARRKLEPTEMRIMEMQDHEECLSKGVNPTPEIAIELYWRCRAVAIDRRIKENSTISGKAPFYKREFKVIKKILKNRVIQAQNANSARITEDIDGLEHQICILKYYDERAKGDVRNYNKCRRELIINRTPPKPFGKGSYEVTKQDAENPTEMEYVLKSKEIYKNAGPTVNDKAEEAYALMVEFPICSKYKVLSEEFKKCIKAQQEAKECQQNIERKIEERKINDKIFCEQQAIKDFPDELAMYIKKDKEKTTQINDKNLTEYTDEYDPEIGPKISKGKVISLRETSYNKCIKRRYRKLKQYKKFLPNECKIIGIDWGLEEKTIN